jgi:prepilin-type N-terminal cleavage/methylation domain-containing protein
MKKIAQNIKIKSARGFTLIEMLVATAVFMSVMTVAVSALITIINADKQSQNIKTTTDAVTFAIDTMSRDMRVGTDYTCLKDSTPTDGPQGSEQSDCAGGSRTVGYLNNSGQYIKYSFTPPNGTNSSGVLTENTCDSDFTTCSSEDLISSDSGANISNVEFYVMGVDCENGGGICSAKAQPGVLISVSGVIPETTSTTTTEFDLQTKIMQRSIK